MEYRRKWGICPNPSSMAIFFEANLVSLGENGERAAGIYWGDYKRYEWGVEDGSVRVRPGQDSDRGCCMEILCRREI